MSVIISMPQDEENVDALQSKQQHVRKASSSTRDSHADSDYDSDVETKQEGSDDEDGASHRHSAEMTLDPKEVLIVKDGTIKVANPYKEPEPQYDANGELIKASGTWTQVEHDRFLKAVQAFPKGPWKAIAAMVGSRTVRQTQTHAQKYREKMSRRLRGLRNRNGTLQTPPMRLSQLVATSPVYGQLVMPAMQYTHRPQSLGVNVEYLPMPHQYMASSPTHAMVETPHMMRPTIPSDIYYAYPPHPLHAAHGHHQVPSPQGMTVEYDGGYKHHPHPHHYIQATPPHAIPVQHKASPTNVAADVQPALWTENAPKTLVPAPDYNESMDFLMNFYTLDPNNPAHAHLIQMHHQQQQHQQQLQQQQAPTPSASSSP